MSTPEEPSPLREGEPKRNRDDHDDRDRDDDRPRRRRRRDEDDPPDIGADAGMRMLLPVGRSPWAIISGYLGLLSLLCVPAPFALITGILAIMDIRKSNGKKHGMGRAVFGIIMGAIGSVFLLIGIAGMIAATVGKR